MSTTIRRAGLALGVIGIAFAAPVRADDFRSTQSLIESGLFLSQAEADAVYARLDASHTAQPRPAPGTTAYWESGAIGLGQSDRSGRLGWSGDATQMRIGGDHEFRPGFVAGASAAASIGGVGSADLSARVIASHADVYARFDGDNVFVKTLVGASTFRFDEMTRGAARAAATGYAMRAGGQIGGSAEIAGVKVSPTIALTATGHALGRYRETGAAAASFADRQAGAATATLRLSGARRIRLDPSHSVDVSGFVGADEVVAYSASVLKARTAGTTVATRNLGTPTGRGLVGGLGLGTTVAQGVSFKVDYDYGRRDGVTTKTGRARLGVAF
ncbi:hypothetical protein [Methylopila sp. M107]|uniref:hypothetical protein n=1 Tax=Methylopila sp. M107 TaxID=1101190 RepID=UPI00037466BB|nr:hypothetical protein [Methylopila sp. M107]